MLRVSSACSMGMTSLTRSDGSSRRRSTWPRKKAMVSRRSWDWYFSRSLGKSTTSIQPPRSSSVTMPIFEPALRPCLVMTMRILLIMPPSVTSVPSEKRFRSAVAAVAYFWSVRS